MAESPNKAEISPNLLKQVINPFTLGADPEFVILDKTGHQIYNAEPYGVRMKIVAGEIGHDHGGRVWELRPSASQSSYGVLVNIWRLLKSDHMKTVSDFKWKSGAIGGADTIGGHVHFGIPVLNQAQLDTLAFVTEGLEALEILPQAESSARRQTGRNLGQDYGGLKSTRDSLGHIEYRAPASWLGSPGQALAVLTAYKLAATEPLSVTWPKSKFLKGEFEKWVAEMSTKDVDAFLLNSLIEKRGFDSLQVDPQSDFKPQWRKEELWQK